MGMPRIERAEIDKLATEWCKAKHVVIMIDEVSRQFACDVANLVLKNFVDSMAEAVAARKAAAVGNPSPETAKIVKKPTSSIILTD